MANKKYTTECCKKIALDNGGRCLSTEYINKQSKLTWCCENNHKCMRDLSVDIVFNRILEKI